MVEAQALDEGEEQLRLGVCMKTRSVALSPSRHVEELVARFLFGVFYKSPHARDNK